MEKTVRKLLISYLALLFISLSVEPKVVEEESHNVVPTINQEEMGMLYTVLHYDQIEDRSEIDDQIEEEVESKERSYTEDDLYWLSRIVSAEAKGEPIEGQIAVANVVLNRVNNEEFPDSIKEVIFQKNQFSPVKNKAIYKEPTEEAVQASIQALEGERVVDEDVLFFFNPKIAPKRSWMRTREEAVTIGEHRFTY